MEIFDRELLFFLDRKYLKLQDNLISGPVKAPSAISSTPNFIPAFPQCRNEGRSHRHLLPSWQH